MEIILLNDIVIIFGLSLAVIFLFNKIKLPPIIGFLFTGIIAGPFGLKLVQSVHEVEILSEVGILLLLFTIGIEFSFNEILKIKKTVLLGGSFQVFITIISVFFIAVLSGFPNSESIFIGFLIALSSTAIVLKLYNEKGEIDSPHGRTALAILIFQDIIVVPMMLITPLLGGGQADIISEIINLSLKSIGVIVFVIISTKYIVPFLLFHVAKLRSRELFLISIIVICFGIVWITSSIGLSLALGAFLAGLIISESEYSHQALSNIMPFRDVFTSLFFVSIGMLLNYSFMFENFRLIILITIIIILLKSAITSSITMSLGFPLRTAVIAGISLSQVGEFSFILAKTGSGLNLISADFYQMFLSVSILTMAATPFLIKYSPKFADQLLKLPLPQKIKSGMDKRLSSEKIKLKDHLIIVGFGINGRNLAMAAGVSNIPYTILEMNPDTVKEAKKNNEPIHFGDASSEELLNNINVAEAKIAVVAINDQVATRKITQSIKMLNKNIYLIVRTRYVNELNELYNLGADEVIPEEFETSIEIFSRVLNKYLVPQSDIQNFIETIRLKDYSIFRNLSKGNGLLNDVKLNFPDVEITSIIINNNSPLAGKTLSELDFRNNFNATVLGVICNTGFISNPSGNFTLSANDTLYLFTTRENIAKVKEIAGLNTSFNSSV